MVDDHRVHPVMVDGAPHPAPLEQVQDKQHSRCRRCALLVVITLGAMARILYAVFWPKTPTFRVERLTPARFDVNTTSMTLSYAFEVRVTVENPNQGIGLSYDGGWVAVSFNGTELRRSAFPELCQGHSSTVRPLIITLDGETRLNGVVAGQLVHRLQQAGFGPLGITAHVPVGIKFRGLRGELGAFSERLEVRIINFLVVVGLIRIGLKTGLKGIGALALWLATVAFLGGIISGLLESCFQYLIILD